MEYIMKKMLLSCLVASSVISIAACAGNEYLPPSKGYSYKPPRIPFITPTKPPQPPQPPVTSPPQRPQPYLPPVTTTRPFPKPQPTPTPHVPDHPHEHHEHHDHDHHDHHDHHHHHEPGMPFDFAYAVNEDGNDYQHNAVSDGDVTRGEYRVALPDGRVQIVKYTADWKNGFNADVSYEGEARYPEPNTNSISSPNQGQAYLPANQGGGYKY
ncbi:endocuticle structural glycoprotein SgAbd-1 isoform X2 [Papilio machaon]|uniref:endocuticle structural glycoprotein SgAbd-1 isoform X2 n=1 Tax=Papilio machaon TaxID=76193 RepID=UPI001E663913|nr:endocuticle structural glycoprotein SgAbd-1 isoform X2 [Papilio machaon]